MAQPVIRTVFTDPLRELEADSLRMGSLVLEMVSLATRVVLEDQDHLAEKVMNWEEEVDRTEQNIIERVINTLAEAQTVGDNLRFLSSTLFLVNELEKIGDEATKLASRIVKMQGEFPYEMIDLLREMSTLAQANLRESLRLYSQYSPEAAERLVAQDDAVDQTFKTSRNILLGMIRAEPDRSRQLLRCLEIFHALEHVSDRAADIAKRLQTCYDPRVKVS
jgi:phosphate transport system protein